MNTSKKSEKREVKQCTKNQLVQQAISENPISKITITETIYEFKDSTKSVSIENLDKKEYCFTNSNQTFDLNNPNKIKWKGTALELGLFFRQLLKMGYLEYPLVKNGTTLIVANLLKMIFDIDESAKSLTDTLSVKKDNVRVETEKNKLAKKIDKLTYGSNINYHVDSNQIFCIPNRNIPESD